MAFFVTVVERKAFADKLRRDPSLVAALSRVTEGWGELREYIDKQMDQREDNFVTIQIRGPQGCGKSGVGQEIAETCTRAEAPFSVNKITLHYDLFFSIVAALRRGEFGVLDEQTKLHGTGSTRIGDDIINIIETLRQSGGSIIVISPSEKMVSVADVHLDIEVLARDGARVLCAWRSRSDTVLGCCVFTLKWNSPLWLSYMAEKKRAYVTDAKELKFYKNDYERLAEKVMTHPDAAGCSKASHWRLVMEKAIPNMTIDEKRLVLAQIQLNLSR
jgi:hypothetical protein